VTTARELRLRPGVALAVAIALLLAGGSIAYVIMSAREHAPSGLNTAARPASPEPASGATSSPAATEPGVPTNARDRLPDVVVPLGDEAVARAGIKTGVVVAAKTASEIRLPGVVEANAYRQVAVTPLVSGRVSQVLTELGAHVKRDQPIARVYSPELAEAETRYVAVRAMLEAHDRELQRTEKLVAIGAASRQELERAHADHTAQLAEVEAARSRLRLLGIPANVIDDVSMGKSVDATATIVAPLDGVVTERLANVGLNVDASTKLFSVVDLATVWVVADVYEKDLSRVSVGTTVIVTTAAYPDLQWQGRVSYIDPQVSGSTRTAKIRVEVANSRGELRLGMFATVLVQAAATSAAILIPRTAVQQVGDRQVAYLRTQEAGTFIEREITTARRGDQVEVLSGLQPGDTIVIDGSFFVRAERERLGLRQPSSARSPTRQGGEHEPHHH
jgi:membrane fusion protein, heavy metal efflux system